MQSTDEIIESGFSGLRRLQSSREPSRLVAQLLRRRRRTRVLQTATGSTAFAAACLTAFVALRPESALASLERSVRLSAAQAIIHIQSVTKRVDAVKVPYPWPPAPKLQIWRFPNRYVQAQGHELTVKYKDGHMFYRDDRFADGCTSNYDAASDQFWNFDGTIRLSLQALHRTQPIVQDVQISGRPQTEYSWTETDAMGNKTNDHVFVDPQTKLIVSSRTDEVAPIGDGSSTITTLDYPSGANPAWDQPRFPVGLNFRTKEELQNDFDRRIGQVDQTKTVGGIRVSLHGVIVAINVPDGLAVHVISQGGANPATGSGHPAEVVGLPILPEKRIDWFRPRLDPAHTRFSRFVTIQGEQYKVDLSEDLLYKAPKEITVRVPVWSPNSHRFLGYATFKTSKIFYGLVQDGWFFYGP